MSGGGGFGESMKQLASLTFAAGLKLKAPSAIQPLTIGMHEPSSCVASER